MLWRAYLLQLEEESLMYMVGKKKQKKQKNIKINEPSPHFALMDEFFFDIKLYIIESCVICINSYTKAFLITDDHRLLCSQAVEEFLYMYMWGQGSTWLWRYHPQTIIALISVQIDALESSSWFICEYWFLRIKVCGVVFKFATDFWMLTIMTVEPCLPCWYLFLYSLSILEWLAFLALCCHI